jgi:hypothetical protein
VADEKRLVTICYTPVILWYGMGAGSIEGELVTVVPSPRNSRAEERDVGPMRAGQADKDQISLSYNQERWQ